jgi:cellulose synthase/poly-beta-1,6-N-acetylglucosamine synthase-like glycosyltransferase
MEEKYGRKQAVLRVQGMILLPIVMAVLLFSVAFAAVLITGLNSGNVNLPVVIISGILDVGALAVLLKQIFAVNLVIYEKCLVQNNLFGQKVMPAESISAMLWTFSRRESDEFARRQDKQHRG